MHAKPVYDLVFGSSGEVPVSHTDLPSALTVLERGWVAYCRFRGLSVEQVAESLGGVRDVKVISRFYRSSACVLMFDQLRAQISNNVHELPVYPYVEDLRPMNHRTTAVVAEKASLRHPAVNTDVDWSEQVWTSAEEEYLAYLLKTYREPNPNAFTNNILTYYLLYTPRSIVSVYRKCKKMWSADVLKLKPASANCPYGGSFEEYYANNSAKVPTVSGGTLIPEPEYASEDGSLNLNAFKPQWAEYTDEEKTTTIRDLALHGVTRDDLKTILTNAGETPRSIQRIFSRAGTELNTLNTPEGVKNLPAVISSINTTGNPYQTYAASGAPHHVTFTGLDGKTYTHYPWLTNNLTGSTPAERAYLHHLNLTHEPNTLARYLALYTTRGGLASFHGTFGNGGTNPKTKWNTDPSEECPYPIPFEAVYDEEHQLFIYPSKLTVTTEPEEPAHAEEETIEVEPAPNQEQVPTEDGTEPEPVEAEELELTTEPKEPEAEPAHLDTTGDQEQGAVEEELTQPTQEQAEEPVEAEPEETQTEEQTPEPEPTPVEDAPAAPEQVEIEPVALAPALTEDTSSNTEEEEPATEEPATVQEQEESTEAEPETPAPEHNNTQAPLDTSKPRSILDIYNPTHVEEPEPTEAEPEDTFTADLINMLNTLTATTKADKENEPNHAIGEYQLNGGAIQQPLIPLPEEDDNPLWWATQSKTVPSWAQMTPEDIQEEEEKAEPEETQTEQLEPTTEPEPEAEPTPVEDAPEAPETASALAPAPVQEVPDQSPSVGEAAAQLGISMKTFVSRVLEAASSKLKNNCKIDRLAGIFKTSSDSIITRVLLETDFDELTVERVGYLLMANDSDVYMLAAGISVPIKTYHYSEGALYKRQSTGVKLGDIAQKLSKSTPTVVRTILDARPVPAKEHTLNSLCLSTNTNVEQFLDWLVVEHSEHLETKTLKELAELLGTSEGNLVKSAMGF